MAKRVCAEPGCPTLTDTTRCPAHTRAREQARGSRQARGYDAAHQRERADWQGRIDAGEHIPCARCGQPINGPWHLDHSDDRRTYIGPSHARCNLIAAGKARHR